MGEKPQFFSSLVLETTDVLQIVLEVFEMLVLNIKKRILSIVNSDKKRIIHLYNK